MIDSIGTLRWIYRKVGQIFDLVNAMLVLKETGGTVNTAVINTEYDVYRVEAPMGVFEPRKLQVDFTNQTVAETVIVRLYRRITGGGGLLTEDHHTFAGVQDPVLRNIELEPNRHGIQVTIERIGGAARDYEWAVFYHD